MLLLRAQVGVIGLYKTGLNVTLLALGTALMLIAFTQAMRAGSRVTAPLRWFGRNSYEIYLTHMMVIFALLPLARRFDPDGRWLPVSFPAMIALSGVLGGAIAQFFSEPMNRKLRVRTRQAQAHVA
jgi:peptidoglycan/LPS O-acetylase OafA/YrhL